MEASILADRAFVFTLCIGIMIVFIWVINTKDGGK